MLQHDFVTKMFQTIELQPLQLQCRVVNLLLRHGIAALLALLLSLTTVYNVIKAFIACAASCLSLHLVAVRQVLIHIATLLAYFEVLGVACEDVASHVRVKASVVLLALNLH